MGRYNATSTTAITTRWNTHSPQKLLQSLPSVSSYAPNYDNGFIKHLNAIKKMVKWLENECDIFDKSLLNETEFKQMKNEFDIIHKIMNASIYKIDRKFLQKNAKRAS